MAHPNEDLVRRGYAAFSTGDMATLSELFSPDIVQRVDGDHLLSGDYKGRDAVFGFFGRMMELSGGTLSVDLDGLKAEGDDRVITHHTGTAERNGKTLTVGQTLVFTIADGVVVDVAQTSDDPAAENAFWV